MTPPLYVIGFVVFMFLALFLPFEWWQRPPSKQPDRIIGRLLPFLRISLRNIVLRSVFLCILILVYLYSILWVPILSALAIIGMIVGTLFARIRGRSTEPVIGMIVLMVIGILFLAGLMAPLRLLPIAGYWALGRPAGNIWEALTIGKEWILLDDIIGFSGIFGVTSWLFVDAVWRFRQASQVKNLATSRIASLAVGLVEVVGAVRPVAGGGRGPAVESSYSMFDYLRPEQRIAPFLLEDKTGSVLIDAADCRVRAGWISEVASIFGVREIVLTRRVERDDFTDAVKRTLAYGDRAYVIGNAERGESGNLVIRPASRPGWNEVLWRTLFGAIKPPKGKDIHDVFFVTDREEAKARRHILKGFRTVLCWGLLWIVSSILILWTSHQPWKLAPPPESWRNAHWRGPEPNPDPRVMDFTRNERLFRFEKYIQGLDPASADALPALLEALTYEDRRFRDPATWKLAFLFPKDREVLDRILPVLIENLGSDNGILLQDTILALSHLGPDGAPAVPALVSALKCQATNTYEVTPPIVRFQAARALGEIGSAAREALPALVEALDDPSPAVREDARRAITKIQGNRQPSLIYNGSETD